MLVTSRIPLRIAAERVVPLGPLPPPDATELMVERMQAATGRTPDPAIAAELAARLDGLPLGIELAAATCRSLPPAEVLSMLTDRIPLPQGPRDIPERQRTMAAVVEWSIASVGPEDRRLLSALTPFRGPVELDAIGAVAAGAMAVAAGVDGAAGVRTGMARLVDAGLVLFDGGEYRLLQPIRDVVEAGLDPATIDDLARKHADWAIAMTHAEAPGLYVGDGAVARERLIRRIPSSGAAFNRLVAVARSDEAAHLILDIGQVWFHAGRYHEAEAALDRVIRFGLSPRTEAEAMTLRGIFLKMTGAADAADPLLTAGVDRLRVLAPGSIPLVNGLCHLADLRLGQERPDDATRVADQAVAAARATADPGTISMALDLAGYVARAVGDRDRAIEAARDSVAEARGHDRFLLADALAGLAASLGPDDPTAAAIAWEAVELADASRQPIHQAKVIVTVAAVLAPAEPVAMAARLADAVATYLAVDSRPSLIDAGLPLVRIGAATDPEAAACLLGAVERRGVGDADGDGSSDAEIEELRSGLAGQLGAGPFARAAGRGAAFDDDALGRHAASLAATIAARAGERSPAGSPP